LELARQQFRKRSAQQQIRIPPQLPVEPRIIVRIHAALESLGRCRSVKEPRCDA